MGSEKEIEQKILDTFAAVAGSIGYSDLHGKIIAALLVEDAPISLQELSKKTGYSTSMLSLSLDFLEVLGVIKKIKKAADRKLYVQFQGDLLEILRKAVLIKAEKSISDSLAEFEASRKQLQSLKGEKRKKLLHTLDVLEKQMRRLEKYLSSLSGVEVP